MIDKEDIYDEKIAPLMSEIIKICKENDIPMVASYQLTDGADEDETGEGPLFCSTVLNSEWQSDKLSEARAVLFRRPQFVAMTITTTKP